MDRDKDSLLNRVKAVCTTKQEISRLLHIGRQMIGHSQENRAHHALQFQRMINTSTLNIPPTPFSFFTPDFIASLLTRPLYGISLCPVWVSCPVFFSSSLCTCTSSLVEQQRSEKVFDLALLSNN